MLEKILYLISKLLRRMRPPALQGCKIEEGSRVLSNSDLRNVVIGRYSYCGYRCQINNCTIGSFCSISDTVVIGRAEHQIQLVSTSPVFVTGNNTLRANFASHPSVESKKTIIGSDVWIGVGAIIRAGVRVGDGAVIGAGSVVTKDVPPYSIFAGAPAKEIRKRFDEETIEALLAIRWWEWPSDRIISNGDAFSSPSELIKRNLGK